MAGPAGAAAEVDSLAQVRRHRGTGGGLDAKAEAGGVRRTFATCNWHVQWNTAAARGIPAGGF